MSQTLQANIRFVAAAILGATLALGGAVVWSGPAPDGKQTDIEVQYAKAQLRVAELNLQKLKRTNEQLARTVPSNVVGEYQQDVEIARQQLQAAESGDAAGAFAVWLRRAAADEFTAQSQWK